MKVSGVSLVHVEENFHVTLMDSTGAAIGPSNPLPTTSSGGGGSSHVIIDSQTAGLALAANQQSNALTDEELRLSAVEVVDAPTSITPKAVTATASGETVIITPSSGNAVRLWWYNLSANPNNSAHAVVGLRFGTGAEDFYRTALSQYGAATAHSFKAGKSYYQGGTNEPLILNSDVAQTIYVNIDFEEVTP